MLDTNEKELRAIQFKSIQTERKLTEALNECYSTIAALEKANAKLQVDNEKVHCTMRLHAGDCCSLNTEVELFRGHWEDAETQCSLLQKKLAAKQLSWIHKKLSVLFGTRCPVCYSKNFEVNFMLRHGCNKCEDCGHIWGNSTHRHDQ